MIISLIIIDRTCARDLSWALWLLVNGTFTVGSASGSLLLLSRPRQRNLLHWTDLFIWSFDYPIKKCWVLRNFLILAKLWRQDETEEYFTARVLPKQISLILTILYLDLSVENLMLYKTVIRTYNNYAIQSGKFRMHLRFISLYWKDIRLKYNFLLWRGGIEWAQWIFFTEPSERYRISLHQRPTIWKKIQTSL